MKSAKVHIVIGSVYNINTGYYWVKGAYADETYAMIIARELDTKRVNWLKDKTLAADAVCPFDPNYTREDAYNVEYGVSTTELEQ